MFVDSGLADIPQIEDQDSIDKILLERISKHQDKQALADLYEHYRHPVGSFLRSKLRATKLVEEVFNDVMLTVWQKADSFQAKSKVSTWIFGIAYRTCLSHMRKETKHTERADEYEINDMAEVQESTASEQVRASISELSEDHRTVIELAYYFGHSVAEISDIVDCPVSTVKTRLFYARQHLKSSIETQLNLQT